MIKSNQINLIFEDLMFYIGLWRPIVDPAWVLMNAYSRHVYVESDKGCWLDVAVIKAYLTKTILLDVITTDSNRL